MASLADVPNTQACRTVASSSEVSRENMGDLLMSTMAPAKLGLPRRGGGEGGTEAGGEEEGDTGGCWREDGGAREGVGGRDDARARGSEEQGAESSLSTLSEKDEMVVSEEKQNKLQIKHKNEDINRRKKNTGQTSKPEGLWSDSAKYYILYTTLLL